MPDEQKQLLQRIESLLEAGDSAALTQFLDEQRASDIAEIVELLNNEQRRTIFDVLDKPIAAKVMEKVDEATRAELFELLEDKELKGVVSELDPDDAADLLAELPDEERRKLLQSIEPTNSAKIKKLMSYSEDSAGGIMDPLVISVPEDATVAEAVNKIRAAEIDEDFFSVYVVDKTGRFLGDVRIRLLLTSHEDVRISTLIDPDTIYVTADADQEQVRNIFSKNDLIVVPVLDRNHKLIGRITADRVIEVAEEEAAEDLYRMAGTDADELDDVSAFHAARVRMIWLSACLFGTGVTALILMLFQQKIDPLIYVTAVAFVPMIADMSGNTGQQTAAIVLCGLATGHLAAQKLSRVFLREVRVAFLVAITCGIIGGCICAFLPQLAGSLPTIASSSESTHIITIDFSEHMRIALAFGTGMFSAIMVATTLGLFLPFFFHRIGMDPAISTGPLVTTINDSTSVAIYMTLTLLLV
ncbi:MAG: magnesium transporter [Planctomycetota bacterium]|nr:MAG: magnesium transporter [Planctomycetota bacterium]